MPEAVDQTSRYGVLRKTRVGHKQPFNLSVRRVLFRTQLFLQIRGFHLRSLQIRCLHSARCIGPASRLALREGHAKFRALAWSPYRRKPIEILRRTALSQNTYYRTPLGAIARSGHLSLSPTVESESSEKLHQSSLIIIASGGDFTKNTLCTNGCNGSQAIILHQNTRPAAMRYEAAGRRLKIRNRRLNVCSFKHQSFVQFPGELLQSATSRRYWFGISATL